MTRFEKPFSNFRRKRTKTSYQQRVEGRFSNCDNFLSKFSSKNIFRLQYIELHTLYAHGNLSAFLPNAVERLLRS